MRKTTVAGAVVAALALTACASTGDKAAAPVSSLRFTYTAEGGQAIGLVRAFDDGKRTALQFITDPPGSMMVFDGEGRALAYERIGQNVVLPGLYSPVRVQIGPVSALVKSTTPIAAAVTKELIQQPGPAPASAAPTVAAHQAEPNLELLAARAALQLAQQQIAELRAELGRVQAAKGSGQDTQAIGRKLDKLEALVGDAAAVILRVEFGFASIDFRPSEEVARVLVPAAKAAERVTLRAYTDSRVADDDNKRIALARALTARRYLISQGVDPKKIRAYYQSAGGFIADNSTAEGRARNRRVDIEIVSTKLAGLGQATAQLAAK